jgi:hypothetical protein
MAKATLPNADARKELFWKMEGRWVISSKVFSFLRDLMTEYIHDNNTTKLKPKPKIKSIIISEDKLQFLNRKLEDTKVLGYQKRELITKIAGGLCAICQETPTKVASYDMHGITLIERYCDKYIEKISLD